MIRFDLNFVSGDFVYREYRSAEWLDTPFGDSPSHLREVFDEDVLNFAAKTPPDEVVGLIWAALQKGKTKFRLTLPALRRAKGTLTVERFGKHVCLFVHRCKNSPPLVGVAVERREDKGVIRAEKKALRAAVKLFATHFGKHLAKGIRYITPLNATGLTCFLPELDGAEFEWQIEAMILGHVLSRPNPIELMPDDADTTSAKK